MFTLSFFIFCFLLFLLSSFLRFIPFKTSSSPFLSVYLVSFNLFTSIPFFLTYFLSFFSFSFLHLFLPSLLIEFPFPFSSRPHFVFIIFISYLSFSPRLYLLTLLSTFPLLFIFFSSFSSCSFSPSVYVFYLHLSLFSPNSDGEQGWFNTGDMGSLDTEGYIFISGKRKKKE